MPRCHFVLRIAALSLAVLAICAPLLPSAGAQDRGKPYDQKLYRLSELLGAVHYLRELCGANDGQKWRERMNELIEAEGNSAIRRVTLTRHFNRGYRSYSRTYRSCTTSAQASIDRFIAEAIKISEGLIKLAR